MLLRWLMTEFPRDMQRGWLLIKANLGFWCAVAAGLAVLAVIPFGDGTADTSADVAVLVASMLLRVLVPLVLVVGAVRFAAASDGRQVGWASVMRSVKSRIVPVALACFLAAVLCRAGALFAEAAAVAILQTAGKDPNVLRAWAELVGGVVFVVLLVRFAFVPFLAGLRRGSEFRSGDGGDGVLGSAIHRIAWPLIESNRMTSNVRRELLPYLVLGFYAPGRSSSAAWSSSSCSCGSLSCRFSPG